MGMYDDLLPFRSEIITKRKIKHPLTEFATVERVYSNLTALVTTSENLLLDGVLIPLNIGIRKGTKPKGRLPILQKGQLVLIHYFNELKDSGAIVSIYPHIVDNLKDLNLFRDTIENDSIDYTEQFADFQDEYRIIYKDNRYFIYDIASKKEIYSFQVKDKQFYFGNKEDATSNEKLVIELSKEEKLSVGKADMNAVSLDELKKWMDDIKKYMDDVKTWMDDTKGNVTGIMDALKNGTTVPSDGGSTYKATISTSLAKIKQPDSVKTPTFPEKTTLGNTNLKISKKGS